MQKRVRQGELKVKVIRVETDLLSARLSFQHFFNVSAEILRSEKELSIRVFFTSYPKSSCKKFPLRKFWSLGLVTEQINKGRGANREERRENHENARNIFGSAGARKSSREF